MQKIITIYLCLATILPQAFSANTLQYLTSYSLPNTGANSYRYFYFHGDGTKGSLNGCLVDFTAGKTELALYSIGVDYSGDTTSSSVNNISLPTNLIPAGSQYCSATPVQGIDSCAIAGVCDTADQQAVQFFTYFSDQGQTQFGSGPFQQFIPVYAIKTNADTIFFYRPANGSFIDSRLNAAQQGPYYYVANSNDLSATKANAFEVVQVSPNRYFISSSLGDVLSVKVEDCSATSCTQVGSLTNIYMKFVTDGTNWYGCGISVQAQTTAFVGVKQNGAVALPTSVYAGEFTPATFDLGGMQACVIGDTFVMTTNSVERLNYTMSALSLTDSFNVINQVMGKGGVKAMHCKDSIIAVVTTLGIDYYAWNLDLNVKPGSPASITPITTPVAGLTPEQQTGLIVGLVVGSAVAAGAIVLAVLLDKRRRKRKGRPSEEAVENLQLTQFDKKLLIPYKDIVFTKEIGAGSFGKVFIGEWRGVDVAIKMNSRLSSKDAESFLKEAKLTLQLPPHPNVVQTYGVCLDSEFPYILLEFCDGGSLDKILSKQQLNVDEQKALVKGIAFGLLHLHSHNIVHRDLAARNILVGDKLPKISDFGMSRVLKDGTQQGQTVSRIGPVRWMAPESIRDAAYSVKSDVWTFGIVVSEVVNGHEPHAGEDQINVARKIRDESYTPNIASNCAPVLKEIMEMCWKTDPAERPTMQELCDFIGEKLD